MDFIQVVDLHDWKTKKQILSEIREKGILIDERKWRFYVEEHNKMYCDDLVDSYIVHSLKGYKLTKDRKEIIASIEDLKKRGLNMLWKHSQATKALGFKQNLKMELEELEIIER